MGFEIIEMNPENSGIAEGILKAEWGLPVYVKGKIYNTGDLSGYLAFEDNSTAGLITYVIENNQCNIVTLNALRKNRGIGTALMREVEEIARENGCVRIWLVTTNDNIDALRFYQMKGFVIADIHVNSISRLRMKKPVIPDTGCYGIPMRDEIEMEKLI